MLAAALTLSAPGLVAAPAWAACPGYSVCPIVPYARAVAHNPRVLAALAAVDAQEAATVAALSGNSLSFAQLLALLGQALVFDKSLSVHSNEACAFCHSAAAGFGGGVQAFVPAGGIFPGALPTRTGPRAPQSLAYAAFAPVLAVSPNTQTLIGGNFWDGRATGLITGSPAADQAQVPLTTPFEMALPDPACAVRRVQLAAYGAIFGKVWGGNSLAITWPADTDNFCTHPNNGAANPKQLHLSGADRARATLTVNQIGLTISAYEESGLASPFTSKFDAVQAGQARFTAQEAAGFALFTGQARCSYCHSATGTRALFTNFTAADIGTPPNPTLPYLTENQPDPHGYTANPLGGAYLDEGMGGFLASAADTNPQWQALAARYIGAFQVPTLRNVAARPGGLIRTYMHNGYFKNLKTIVHFYNTRDVLPRCTGTGTGLAGVACWPAPEEPANENTGEMGNLGLSDAQEGALVAFMETLTDGYGE